MRGTCGDLNTACSHTSFLELFRSSEDALDGMRELIEASRADHLVVDPQIQTILTRFNTH